MIEDLEDNVKKVIINAARNALCKLNRGWRFKVFRTARSSDHELLWRVDLVGADSPGWITFQSPPDEGVDEAWYTKEIVRLIEELINKQQQ